MGFVTGFFVGGFFVALVPVGVRAAKRALKAYLRELLVEGGK